MAKYSRILVIALILTLIGCAVVDPPKPEVSVKLTDFEQNYYQSFGGWSDLVQIWYSIRNIGDVDIGYFKIWFEATCSDGTTYEDWTNGIGLDRGHSIDDYTFISVPGKRVVSVVLVEYQLRAG